MTVIEIVYQILRNVRLTLYGVRSFNNFERTSRRFASRIIFLIYGRRVV